jgi:hypothetical protein
MSIANCVGWGAVFVTQSGPHRIASLSDLPTRARSRICATLAGDDSEVHNPSGHFVESSIGFPVSSSDLRLASTMGQP